MAGSQTPLLVKQRQVSESGRLGAIGAVTAGALLCGFFLLSRSGAWEQFALVHALKVGVLNGVDTSVFFKKERGAEAVFAPKSWKATTPDWMYTGDSCQGWFQDPNYNGQVYNAVAKVAYDPNKKYDCPSEYHWGTKKEIDAAYVGSKGYHHYSQCGWSQYNAGGGGGSAWQGGGSNKYYWLASDENAGGRSGARYYYHSGSYGSSSLSSMECTSRYSSCKIYFAGVICVKNPEPVDCAGAWSKWTNCSATCGGGTSTREYVVTTSPQHGGKECPVSACPDGWKSEGGDKCSAPVDGSNAGTCSKLSQFEGYTNTQKNDWAKACSTTWGAKETNTCAPDPCPVDCIGYWDGWSSCSVDCAIGTQTRSYNISRKEQHGGKHCPEKFKSQTKSCDTGVTCPPRNSKGEICKSISPWPLSSGCELRECLVVCQCTHPDKCTFPCECTGRETTTAIPTTTTTAAVPNTTSTPGATCNDGLMSGAEIGVDCGGPICPACVTTTAAPAATCSDGLMNGAETWTDCGGGICPACVTTTAAPAAKVAEEILLESQSSWSADLELLETEQAELASNAQLVRVMTLDATNKEKCTFCPLPNPVVLPAPSKAEVRTFVVGGKELAVLGLQQESENLRSADFAMTSTLRTGADGREVRSYEITQGEIISRYEPIGEAVYER